jgi:hypothetical protein
VCSEIDYKSCVCSYNALNFCHPLKHGIHLKRYTHVCTLLSHGAHMNSHCLKIITHWSPKHFISSFSYALSFLLLSLRCQNHFRLSASPFSVVHFPVSSRPWQYHKEKHMCLNRDIRIVKLRGWVGQTRYDSPWTLELWCIILCYHSGSTPSSVNRRFWSTRYLLDVGFLLAYSSTPKKQVICSSYMSVDFQRLIERYFSGD